MASAAAAPHIGGGSTAAAPVQTTPPPPTPDDPPPTPGNTPPPGTPTAPPSKPDNPPPSPDSTPPPGETDPPGETTAPGETQDPDGTTEAEESDRPVSGQLARQNIEIETATATLKAAGENAPAELAPAVEQLTATLKAVQDPKTSPQEREEVTEIAQQVTSALAVISNPETPPELREQLTVIVRQVASAVEGSLDPRVPPELRATIISTAEQATSVLGLISDPKTPPELKEPVTLIGKQLTATLEQSQAPETHWIARPAADVGGATEMISETPPKQQPALVEATAQAASSLPKLGDPSGSTDERAKAQEVFRQQTAEMKKQKEEAASARGVPDVPLGEAAEVCTNAIFTTVSDRALGLSLKTLLPSKWEIEGVQDFWKAREKEDDSLDVIAQLRNGEHADEPFNVGKLTTRLAELVPARDLFGTIGTPALHCLQAAWHLDQAGITAGTWVEKAYEKKGDN
jgi:hypothetical protein